MTDSISKFARGSAEFTIELLEHLNASRCKENIIVSPLSLQTGMALVFAGAKGDTATEIADVLKYNSNISSEVAETFEHVLGSFKNSDLLKIANKLYVMEGYKIKPEYVTVTREHYNASVEAINFVENVTAAKTINTWVEHKTADKITDLLQADNLNDKTRLVLLNILYLNAEWEQKFKTRSTNEGDFWVTMDETTKVKFMSQTTRFGYGSFNELNCIALEMPYKDCDLRMIVLLPQERDGLRDLAEKLKDVNLLDLVPKMTITQVEVILPKFKIDYSIEMSKVLKQMGITKAFSEDEANLGNMLESPEELYVTDVFHKVSIEVSEDGTIAAVASAVRAIKKCSLPESFIADHPFIYWIGNESSILFAGTFVKPSDVA